MDKNWITRLEICTFDSKKSDFTQWIFILGRDKFNSDWPPNYRYPHLNVEYRTIHASKGLETDHVILVNFESGRFGFPSEIDNDPILDLARSTGESFEFAEERRLFYVALTRAKERYF